MWNMTCVVHPLHIHSEIFSFPFLNFYMLTLFLFHLLFLILLPMDFFCRNEVSVCRYIEAEKHGVPLCCTSEADRAVPCMSSPTIPCSFPSHVLSRPLLIGFPLSTPLLCITVTAKTGISIRLCPSWLSLNGFNNASDL